MAKQGALIVATAVHRLAVRLVLALQQEVAAPIAVVPVRHPAAAVVRQHVRLVVLARVEVDARQDAPLDVLLPVVVDARQVVLVRAEAIALELVVGQPNKVAILVQKHASKTALMPVTRVVQVPVVTLVTWHVIVSVADYVMGPVHHHVKEVEAQLAVHVYSPVM